jgi:hypothetical protein
MVFSKKLAFEVRHNPQSRIPSSSSEISVVMDDEVYNASSSTIQEYIELQSGA